MSTPADKVVITITGAGCTIQASAAGQVIAEQTSEIASGDIAYGTWLARSGDDLFESLPPDLAATLDAMGLNLMDAVIALMPDNA